MQISIQELQKQWGIARSTVYKHIKKGHLTRLDNGLIDVSEIIRVYGEPSHNTQRDRIENTVETAETDILREKIILLESQLAQAEKREEWLKVQVEKAQETIRLLEYKKTNCIEPKKKGLFGRVISAIKND